MLAEVQRGRPCGRCGSAAGRSLEVVVGDGSGGMLTLTFFNQAVARAASCSAGRRGLFAGKVTEFRGKRQLNSPDYGCSATARRRAADEIEEFAGALIPVYPAAAAVPTWTIARCVRLVLDTLDAAGRPAAGRRCAPGASWSAWTPRCARSTGRPTRERWTRARTRLKWDEAFAVQVAAGAAQAAARPAWPADARPRARRTACWPRSTRAAVHAHRRAARGRRGDRRRPGRARTRCTGCCRARSARARPSCALRAMLQVVDAGGQAALLAPTEVLAAQHHRGIARPARPAGPGRRAGRAPSTATRVALLTGSLRRGGPAPGAGRGRRPARPASSSAPTRCSTRASTSPTSAWSSSTSSTGSASSSATRCGPRPTSRRTCWS